MRKNQVMSKEQKKKIAASKRGSKSSDETKKKMSMVRKGKDNPMYGRKHSENTKQKMCIAKQNLSLTSRKRVSDAKMGDKNPRFGKRHSRKTIEIIREGKIGEKNANWKGGISYEPYCDVWLDKDYKESIKERDGYKCLNPECNKSTNRLCLHHIDYDKKNCSPNNLITICISCNTKANKDRNWHKSWYKTILYRKYNVR